MNRRWSTGRSPGATTPLRACALALAWIPAAASAHTVEDCGRDLKGGAQVESARHVVVFRTDPSPIAVSKHFVVEFAVCPKDGDEPPGRATIDATMPEHRHGMNYTPTVQKVSPGRFRAEGLLFHMPGRWEMVFQVQVNSTQDRLVAPVIVR